MYNYANSNSRFSNVKVAGKDQLITVPITSGNKPEIPLSIFQNWQNLVNLISKIFILPSALLMKLHEKEIEVYVSSDGQLNPYKKGEKAVLGLGLYCETVVGTRKPLLVPNATRDDNWNNNPDIEFNMISYYGLPITWPDGEILGTLCILDKKENYFSDLYFELMHLLRDNIEKDLQILLEKEEYKRLYLDQDLLLRETHHRIKNNFNILISLIKLQYNRRNSLNNSFLLEFESRVRTISLIHEKLAISLDLISVSLKSYLTELVKMITEIANFENIKVDCVIPDITVKDKKMISCGLIINELVTNSIKYSFNDIKNPEINIKVKKLDNDFIEMVYYDNGPGLPTGIKIDGSDSLGLKIVVLMAEQLEGQVLITAGKKSSFKFRLKLD
jgi:c-di-GMP phosphodiesterase